MCIIKGLNAFVACQRALCICSEGAYADMQQKSIFWIDTTALFKANQRHSIRLKYVNVDRFEYGIDTIQRICGFIGALLRPQKDRTLTNSEKPQL